jgi:iron complex transport system substrate-binding protein
MAQDYKAGLWTAGSGTFMDEIATMVGIKNAFADVSGWGEISQEQVIERNPDYIITISMYNGEGLNPVEEIIARDGWSGINAVKNAAVYNADSNEITRPGPRLVDAAKALYSFIYEK